MLGWIGWALAFSGMYLIGGKKWQGFVLCMVADLLLIGDSWAHEYWSLFVACWLFFCLHIFNIYRWVKK